MVAISRDSNAILIQAGTLTGFDDLDAGRTLDLIPSVSGSLSSERTSAFGRNQFSRMDPGFTAIYSITPNLTLSMAMNPDFSQVEADVPQITVNQRFALFYPEKRPFFLEGAEVFRTSVNGGINVVNTRQIVDPDWGLKLTGKTGRTTIGVISAYDRAPGRRSGTGDGALFNIGRLQRDVFRDSAMGLTFTDRRFTGESNTVVGLESRSRLAQSTVFGGQFARTWKDDKASYRKGSAWHFRLDQWGRTWKIYYANRRATPDYRAEAGFINRTGFHEQIFDLGYEWRPRENGRWWASIWPYVVAKRSRTPDGRPEAEFVDPALQIIFARNIQLNYWYSFDRETFAGRTFNYQFQNIGLRVERFKHITYYATIRPGEALRYDPQNPVVGNRLFMEHRLVFKPNDKLQSEWLYLKSRIDEKRTDRRLSSQDILRNRTVYQLTRNSAIRSIIEYDTSLRQTGVSLLYGFTPRPNSALYIGYNDLIFNGVDPLDQTRTPAWISQRRTLFMKLSYNLRY